LRDGSRITYIEEQLAWLRREIAGEAFQQATWRLVVMHIPPDWRKEESMLWHGERRVRERFALSSMQAESPR